MGVQETVKPINRAASLPLKPVLQQLGQPFIADLLSSLLVIQATTNAVTPLLSLFVKQLMPHASTGQVILTTGIVAAAPGVATWIGRLIDRLGAQRCLMLFLGIAVIDLLLTSLIQQVGQLIELRLVLGIADAALLPAIQVMTVERVPRAAFGRIFSLNQSAQALGNVVGPGLAVVVANLWNYQAVFLVTAGLELFVIGLWLHYFRRYRQ